jgi:hypothetical protein
VPHPWIRSLKTTDRINTNSKLKIEVSGSTLPLLGNGELTDEKIREKLSLLLERRGFSVDSSSADYIVTLIYKTERHDRFRSYSSVASTNFQAFGISTSAGAGATSGLGVSIARAVSALASKSTTVSEQTTEQMLSYIHTISIEFRQRNKQVIWKGESTWDSDELNLINRIVPALQLILSDLPSDIGTRPEVPEVKENHISNYFKLECENNWFTCPALPYRIFFEGGRSSGKSGSTVPRGVENPSALAAYVDLIQTAEYALPDGDEKDWNDPIKVSLWKRATLGSQYFLGPSKKPVNILIKLTGKTDGYYISECKVVPDAEFEKFSVQFSKWRQVLQDYYDVYVQ